MKNVKTLGLLAFTVVVLTAFTGAASATELTSPKGTKLVNGTAIKASVLFPTVFPGGVPCEASTINGEIINEGNANATVVIAGSSIETMLCGPDTVTVLDPGVWEVHTKNAGSDNTGTVTSSGVAITTMSHRSVMGVPITIHCIYETENTDMGILEGGTLEINAVFPVRTTDGSCANPKWTAFYGVTKPAGALVVD